ncbi:MAG TPA: hypothetical protein VFY42_01970 [Gemmatimonadales bacterium]|nr:hypothetical protein [Gemmatimonadales bacterium]
MNRKRWLALIGGVAVAVAVTGCEDKELRKFVAPDGPLDKWNLMVQDAVCSLEENVANLPEARKLCKGDPPDKTPTPTYPPK